MAVEFSDLPDGLSESLGDELNARFNALKAAANGVTVSGTVTTASLTSGNLLHQKITHAALNSNTLPVLAPVADVRLSIIATSPDSLDATNLSQFIVLVERIAGSGTVVIDWSRTG